MYQEIKDFMLAKQAEFVAGSGLVLVSGGSVDRYEHQDAYALTPQFSALKITGADAEVFLQGQLSSDVAGLADNGALQPPEQMRRKSNPIACSWPTGMQCLFDLGQHGISAKGKGGRMAGFLESGQLQ